MDIRMFYKRLLVDVQVWTFICFLDGWQTNLGESSRYMDFKSSNDSQFYGT